MRTYSRELHDDTHDKSIDLADAIRRAAIFASEAKQRFHTARAV